MLHRNNKTISENLSDTIQCSNNININYNSTQILNKINLTEIPIESHRSMSTGIIWNYVEYLPPNTYCLFFSVPYRKK